MFYKTTNAVNQTPTPSVLLKDIVPSPQSQRSPHSPCAHLTVSRTISEADPQAGSSPQIRLPPSRLASGQFHSSSKLIQPRVSACHSYLSATILQTSLSLGSSTIMASISSSHSPQVPFHDLTASKSSSSLVEDDLHSPNDIPDNHVDDGTRLADLGPLTARDIRTDPILASLARKQVYTPPNAQPAHVFRAKPAPALKDDAGPRMTKSAALRQGIKWETTTAINPRPVTVGTQGKSSKNVLSGEEGRERKAVDFGRTPGHKRDGLSLVSCPYIRHHHPADLVSRAERCIAVESYDCSARDKSFKTSDRRICDADGEAGYDGCCSGEQGT